MFCRECGNQLNDSSKFCNKCGRKVVNNEITTDYANSPSTNIQTVKDTDEIRNKKFKPLKIGILLVTIILLGAAAFFGIKVFLEHKNYNTYLKDAEKAISEEKYDQAMLLLEKASKDKNDESVNEKIELVKVLVKSKELYDTAVKQMNDKKYLEAIVSFQKVDKQNEKWYKEAQSKIEECEKQAVEEAKKEETLKKISAVKEKSIYNFELKDEKSDKYTVFIYSEDSKKTSASFNDGTVWAGASEGDTLYAGHFKVAYIKDDSTDLIIENLVGENSNSNEYTFNTSRPLVKVHKNSSKDYPDLLLIGQTESSNTSSVSCYCIKDGKLKLVGNIMGTAFDIRIKQEDKDTFTTIVYNNGAEDFGWNMLTYKFDKTNSELKFIKSQVISEAELQNYK